MKKIYIQLRKENCEYEIFKKYHSINFELGALFLFLGSWGKYDSNKIYTSRGLVWEWLHLDKTVDGKQVYLWDYWEIKKQAIKEDVSQMEQDALERAYDDYVEKRREDIPKLYMKIENYVEIVQKWQKIVLEEKPTYVVLSQDDTGYVDLVGKDELSEQDLVAMQRDYEKYLKYKVAYDKYVKSRPDIVDELWHGPESSEYEADWQKFLDEPLD